MTEYLTYLMILIKKDIISVFEILHSARSMTHYYEVQKEEWLFLQQVTYVLLAY